MPGSGIGSLRHLPLHDRWSSGRMRDPPFFVDERIQRLIFACFRVSSVVDLVHLEQRELLDRLATFWGLSGLFDSWFARPRPRLRTLRLTTVCRELWLHASSLVGTPMTERQFRCYRDGIAATLGGLLTWQVCAPREGIRKDEAVLTLVAAFRVLAA